MENYAINILFKKRVSYINELDIETLVIFNQKISDQIKQNSNINYKNKLLKLEERIIKPLINKNSNKLYEKLVEILNNNFDIGEEDEIYELFTTEVTKYVIMCINNEKFNLDKLIWSDILIRNYYGDGNSNDIIESIIKRGKKIDIKLFFSGYINFFSNVYDVNSNGFMPFQLYRSIITIDNIPDVIDDSTCKIIKDNFTLNYTNTDKIRGFFNTGPVIEYDFNDNGIFVTDNSKLKVIVKILMNCKSLMLISEYLKETPIFDLNDENALYFVGKFEEENRLVYELQKEEFKKLLKEELKTRIDSNIRFNIRLRKIIELHTNKTNIIDMNVNSYEKKLKKVIDGKSISKS